VIVFEPLIIGLVLLLAVVDLVLLKRSMRRDRDAMNKDERAGP